MATTDIFEAIRKNSLRQMALLIEGGASVNTRASNSETPLMTVVYRINNKDTRARAIRQLLAAGADVNGTNGQGHTALAYACALDQPDSLRIMLEQEGVNANQGDVHGVTPLMVAAVLNHLACVTTIMDFARAGSQRVNVTQPDDANFTALDYASLGSGDRGLLQQLQPSHRHSAKVRPNVAKSRGTGFVNNNSNNNNNNNTGSSLNNNNNHASNNSHVRRLNNKNVSKAPYRAGEEVELTQITPLDLKDSNLVVIHQFAKDVQTAQAQSDGNVVAFAAGSSPRPGSRASAPAPRLRSSASSKSRSQSLERAPSRAGSRLAGRSVERPGSRVGARSRQSAVGMSLRDNEDDDDDDIDLTSLRDLMGTVRDAAREIREIVEPLRHSRGAERRRGGSDKERKKKRKGQGGGAEEPRVAGQRHQVQAEVHVISEINGRVIPPLPPPSPLSPTAPPHYLLSPPQSPSPALPHSSPSAFLHVENEELSHTWPRGRGRSKSRDRLLSGGGEEMTYAPFPISAGSTPLTVAKQGGSRCPDAQKFPSPPPPISLGAARAERQILEKVYGRLSHGGGLDPLVAAINVSSSVPKSRLIAESRQRTVGRARDHCSLQHLSPQSLPHITVTRHAAADLSAHDPDSHNGWGSASPAQSEAPFPWQADRGPRQGGSGHVDVCPASGVLPTAPPLQLQSPQTVHPPEDDGAMSSSPRQPGGNRQVKNTPVSKR